MRKIYLLFVAATLAACSAEPIENEVFTGLDANLAGKSNSKVAAQAVANEFVVPGLICAGEDAEFNINAPVGSNIQVQQYDADLGEWIQVDQTSKSTSNPHVTILNFKVAGDYQLRYKAGTGGFSAAYTITVENCVCEESFSYSDNGNGTYTFNYVPEEAMEGAHLTFTFPQDVVYHVAQPFTQNGNGNDTTFSADLDLVACQTYAWMFGLSADCRGNGKTEANLWTDFKVGDISKREQFELHKIVKSCN